MSELRTDDQSTDYVQLRKLTEACTLLVALLMGNGDEARSSEATTKLFALFYGVKDIQIFSTGSLVAVTVRDSRDEEVTRSIRYDRTNNFDKVTSAHNLVEEIANHPISIDEAIERLREINNQEVYFSGGKRYFGMFLANGGLAFISGGTWEDILPAGIAGMMGIIVVDFFNDYFESGFFAEIAGSFVIGVFAFLFLQLGIGNNLYWMIYGGIMGIAPGSTILSGFREVFTNQSNSGVIIIIRGLVSAIAIAVGVLSAMLLFRVRLTDWL